MKKKEVLIIFVLVGALLLFFGIACYLFWPQILRPTFLLKHQERSLACGARPDLNELQKKYGENLPVVRFLPTEQYPKKGINKDVWLCPDSSEAVVCEYPISRYEEGGNRRTDEPHTIVVLRCLEMDKWWHVSEGGFGGTMFGPFEGEP